MTLAGNGIDVAVVRVSILQHRADKWQSICIQFVLYFGVTWLHPKHNVLLTFELFSQIYDVGLINRTMSKATLP